MQKRTTDMTHGSPLRLIFFFSLPLMVGNIFQQLYTVVDSIVVGQGVGVKALASLGAADWINWLFLWGVQGLTHGFSVPIAHAFGAGDETLVRRTNAMLTLLSAACAAVMTTVSLLLATPLLRLLGTPADIFAGARVYLLVLFAGIPVIFAYNMATAVLRCLGDSRTPLIAMLAASAANVALDLLFVLVFHWGIAGAAFATVLAQLLSFVFCIFALRRIPAALPRRGDWKPDRALLVHLCRLGFPVGLQNAVIAVGGMAVQRVLNGFGFLFVAGFTATNKLYGVLECTAISFGYAMTTYMGQNRGAKRLDRISAGMRSVLGLSVGFSVPISVAMILFGRNILRLFVSASEQETAEVLAIAYRYLVIMSTLLIFLYLLHAYRSSLQGLGNMRAPFWSGVAELVMRVGTALILPRLLGERGIFYAEVLAWAGAAVYLMLAYYAHMRRLRCETPPGIA